MVLVIFAEKENELQIKKLSCTHQEGLGFISKLNSFGIKAFKMFEVGSYPEHRFEVSLDYSILDHSVDEALREYSHYMPVDRTRHALIYRGRGCWQALFCLPTLGLYDWSEFTAFRVADWNEE